MTSKIDKGRGDLQSWVRKRPRNYLDSDSNLQRVLQMYLGEGYHANWPMLHRAGAMSATQIDELTRRSNEDDALPKLERFDNVGQRQEDVVFHPSYYDLGALIWSTAVVAVLEKPGNEVLSAALAYMLSHNGEAGHICPVACTAGLVKLLQATGTDQQKEHFLPLLLQTDYSRRMHASQFITEIQGGSDVGANDCEAVPDEETGMYHISGEKWFCSVADAGVFLMTARPTGADEGTKGLGLFLVPRMVNGQNNNFGIRRLKTKLGTRSLATAEIEFWGALADPILPLEGGFKNLVGVVLDTSRGYNAVAACGMMRRAFLEAQTYAQHRLAFGSPIIVFPAVQETIARMKVLQQAATAATLRIMHMGDLVATGQAPEDLQTARRIQVMINKYWTSRVCTDVIRMGIEVLGGNGTVEDFSVLPRLYRDTMVLENWEGTHNTLCAQVLRDFAQRQLHFYWIEELREALGRVELPQLQPHRERAGELLDSIAETIERLLEGDAAEASLFFRPLVDRMCVLSAFVSLLLELSWEASQQIDSDKPQVVDLFHRLYVDRCETHEIDDFAGLIHTVGGEI